MANRFEVLHHYQFSSSAVQQITETVSYFSGDAVRLVVEMLVNGLLTTNLLILNQLVFIYLI